MSVATIEMKGLVILFGVIPAIIPEVPVVPADPIVTPEVGTVSIVSPSGVLDLVDFSPSSDSDPSEDSLPPTPDLPLVLPFLCSDDTKADGESEPTKQRPVLSSHDTLVPLSEFSLAPVVAPLGICRRSAILVRPAEAIPFGRPYRTYLNGPRKLLTARKRCTFRSFLIRTYTTRHTTRHHRCDFQRSSPQRFAHPVSLAVVTHRHVVKAFRRLGRFAHTFSTPYSTTTSESSLGSSSKRSLDSSSPSFRSSRKRCRTPTASVPSPTHVLRSIAPTPDNLLPPRKRFKDSYSPKDSEEEHIEVDTTDAEDVIDIGISKGVVAHPKDGVGMGFEIAVSDVREEDKEFEAEASTADTREIVVDPLVIGDSSESSRGGIPDLEDTIYDIVHYMSKMVASRERASLVERIRSLRLEYLKVRAMLSIERDRIDSIRWHMALSQEEFHQVRRDRDDTRRRLRRLKSTMTNTRFGMSHVAIEEMINQRVDAALEAHQVNQDLRLQNRNNNGNGDGNGNGNGDGNGDGNGNGTGNGNNKGDNGDGNENRNVNRRGDRLVAHECTFEHSGIQQDEIKVRKSG
ncbi:hypothetical protein Tco_1393826 [Tanacetum coccineum]